MSSLVCCHRSALPVARYVLGTLMVVLLGLSVNNINLDLVQQQQQQQQQQSINCVKLNDKASIARTNQLPNSENNYARHKYPTKKEGLKMIWLMSFPNSGTSYTLQFIREATMTITATNYADEVPKNDTDYRNLVYIDMPDGPFWHQQALDDSAEILSKPKDYLVTKTHCGIRCTDCPPEKYVESTYSFRKKCFETIWTDNIDIETGKGIKRFSSYEPDHLYKAIHIVRDPFDNIVSRFLCDHKIGNRWGANYSTSREGFRDYCRAVSGVHKVNERWVSFLSDRILEIMKDVPCRADFFRYIEWHNQAFVTTHDLDLDVYILKYDQYISRFNETLNEILDFIHLPFHKDGQIPPFIAGKVYRDYFTTEEQRAVAEAFEIMSSAETWFHIKPYFNNLQ